MMWEHEINEGRLALLSHDYDLAEDCFLLALRYLTDGEDVRDVWSDFIPKTQALLGETLFLQKNYAEAWNYLEKAERYYRSYFSVDKYSKAITEYCLAEINLHYGNYDVAMRYFSSAAPNLECQFHPEHRYCRRTAEMLGPDREIESIDTLEFAQKSANDFIASLIESDSQVDDCKSTIDGWIQYAEESFAKGTPRWTFEAYVSLNHALSLTTYCESHFDTHYESILARMSELAIIMRCDQLATRLAHAVVAINVAKYGEDYEGTAKSKALLATVYAQRGQLQIAESFFESALRTLERDGTSAERIIPEAFLVYWKLREYRDCLEFADAKIGEAGSHFEQGKFRQARRCLEKARRKMNSVFPANAEQLLAVQQCLLEVYQRLGAVELVRKTKSDIALIEQQKQELLRQRQAVSKQLPPLAVWIDYAA